MAINPSAPGKDPLRFETLAVHAGVEPDKETGAIMTPVYLTSTYAQEEVGVHKGYEYSRTDTPTRTALHRSIAALEGARFALAFSSGMAATDALVRRYGPGDHVVCGNDVYGGTFRLFDKILSRQGIEFSFVDTTKTENVEEALRPNTRMIWLETPTNPLLKLTDIAALAKITQALGILLAVDNTFASPALQKPIELGADIVVHSSTKYLGGHSDVVGGVIALNDEKVHEELRFIQNSAGAVPGPMDCFLTLRGIKTLAIRMKTTCENADHLARFLEGHEAVDTVIYPGLESHPQNALVRKQMRGGGGIVSFIMKGGAKAADAVASGTEIFTLAESLGGVESLIEVPAVMTHASVADSSLAVDPGLVRISVGIENREDLEQDLKQAFKAV